MKGSMSVGMLVTELWDGTMGSDRHQVHVVCREQLFAQDCFPLWWNVETRKSERLAYLAADS